MIQIIFNGSYPWKIQIKSNELAHAIRDAMYRAMSVDRQINPFDNGKSISEETSLDQLNNADPDKTFLGTNNDKLVITEDRLLFVKNKRHGIKREWVEVFQTDVKGIEINTPGQWPTWYAVMWYFPPW